jgi:hypothetical protein
LLGLCCCLSACVPSGPPPARICPCSGSRRRAAGDFFSPGERGVPVLRNAEPGGNPLLVRACESFVTIIFSVWRISTALSPARVLSAAGGEKIWGNICWLAFLVWSAGRGWWYRRGRDCLPFTRSSLCGARRVFFYDFRCPRICLSLFQSQLMLVFPSPSSLQKFSPFTTGCATVCFTKSLVSS